MTPINDLVESKLKQLKGNSLYFYIHIPRTSGMSIKEQIKRNADKSTIITSSLINLSSYNKFCSQHMTVSEIKNQIKVENLKYIKFFTIVRNPYDRVFSLWSMFKPPFLVENFLDVPSSFDEFVYKYFNSAYSQNYYFESQLFYLKGEELSNIKIIKYENRYEIVKFLNDNYVEYNNKIINKSYDDKIIYSNEIKNMLYGKLQDEFALLNYSI